ncbi:MAG: hypothetical protein INR66_21420 [Gordonia polyisoprenivorans]|nr:hypothetical protein [Gordonia polyisoprenivorans]
MSSGLSDADRAEIREAARRKAADAPPLTVTQRDLLARVWVKSPVDGEASA